MDDYQSDHNGVALTQVALGTNHNGHVPLYVAAGKQNSSSNPALLLQLESLVPRIGEFLLGMGVLRREELEVALEEQQRRLRQGRPDLLGQIILDLGYVDRDTLDRAVVLQVMRLHDTLASYNERLERQVADQTEQLALALERANHLQRHKDEFVNVISHELRTPLTLILGYLDLFRLSEIGSLTAEQMTAFDQIGSAADHLHELISNLLLFATYCRDEIALNSEPILISALFEEVLRQKLETACKKGSRLLVGPPQTPVIVVGDEERIRWVVAELLENALKFTGAGGEISLIGRQKDRHHFEILVRDDGPGISPEQQREIFEPFHQLDGSTTRKVGGIGLGLTLAQHILRAHGSQLEVSSREGLGTEIGFTLPLQI